MMNKKIFVNLTAHKLMKVQLKAIKEMGIEEIVDGERILPPKLIQRLRQCPGDVQELVNLAYDLREKLVSYAMERDAKLFVHLPTGSPAFMWVFAEVFPYAVCEAVFSHTRRLVHEVRQSDGSVVKKSVFKFEGFIFV